MTQFVPFEPKTEMTGQSMLALVAGLHDDIQHILRNHSIEQLEPDQWYPIQLYMDILKDIAGPSHNDSANLVSIGMKIPEQAVFPPQINSLEMALLTLNDAYNMNQRNGYNGSYTSHQNGERDFTIVADNPFPCDFDYGILWSLTRRFCPYGMAFTVRHDDDAECRRNGADSCTYHVTWG
jgi:hypothetical protein